MVRRIEVVPHDPKWAQSFKAAAEKISAILDQVVVTIHHIASTAIPNISSKPVVDILVEVMNIARVDAFDSEFVKLGYKPKGEFGIPGRRFYIKGTEEFRTHHVHIFRGGIRR